MVGDQQRQESVQQDEGEAQTGNTKNDEDWCKVVYSRRDKHKQHADNRSGIGTDHEHLLAIWS